MYKKNYDINYLDNLQKLFENTKLRSYELLTPVHGCTILDIGCGTGQDSFLIAKNGAKVYGIDHDPEMITEAKLRYSGKADIDFIHCEAEAIPLPDNSMDKIRIERVLQHINDPFKVLQECNRILKPGGTLQIIDSDYLSLAFFLTDIVLERKIIDNITRTRFQGSQYLRTIPAFLEKCGIRLITKEVHNYISNGFEASNQLIRLDKIVNEEFQNDNISQLQFQIWQEVKNGSDKHFMLSINLLIYTFLKD